MPLGYLKIYEEVIQIIYIASYELVKDELKWLKML